MKLRITVLEGDGVGPEVTREAVRVLRAVGALHSYEFTFDQKAIGGAAIRQTGSPLPTTTLDACLAADAVLLGAVGSPDFDSLKPAERPEAGLLLLRR
ncbi:MAG TPA: isocitrate/isopropylmalate family dehydrogenase, partial [Candidatus Sulfotelmatobacter sp.]|nr:isocitrate/isopropylmalate family dehydrogenase [Candidatus Sulfotelmatobacter sp.]